MLCRCSGGAKCHVLEDDGSIPQFSSRMSQCLWADNRLGQPLACAIGLFVRLGCLAPNFKWQVPRSRPMQAPLLCLNRYIVSPTSRLPPDNIHRASILSLNPASLTDIAKSAAPFKSRSPSEARISPSACPVLLAQTERTAGPAPIIL